MKSRCCCENVSCLPFVAFWCKEEKFSSSFGRWTAFGDPRPVTDRRHNARRCTLGCDSTAAEKWSTLRLVHVYHRCRASVTKLTSGLKHVCAAACTPSLGQCSCSTRPRARGAGPWSLKHGSAYVWLAGRGPIQIYGAGTFSMAEITGHALTDLSMMTLFFSSSNLQCVIIK